MNTKQINELEKLKELQKKGALTQDEFETAKQKLLNAEASTTTAYEDSSKGIFDCYFDGLKKYFRLKGRSSRYEYWSFTLVNFCISIFFLVIDTLTGINGMLFSLLYSLLLIIPTLTLSVRRLHDLNKSGWYITALIGLNLLSSLLDNLNTETDNEIIWCLHLICLLFTLILFIIVLYWSCQKGNPETNRYGAPLPEESKKEKHVFTISLILFLSIPLLGVVSIGLINSYTQVMEKYKINRTLNQISSLIANIRTAYAEEPSYLGLDNDAVKNAGLAAKEMIDVNNNLINPFGGEIIISNNGELFSITYLGLHQNSCRIVSGAFQDIEGIFVTPDSCSECPNNNCPLTIIAQ